jgi:hypothetical protein
VLEVNSWICRFALLAVQLQTGWDLGVKMAFKNDVDAPDY